MKLHGKTTSTSRLHQLRYDFFGSLCVFFFCSLARSRSRTRTRTRTCTCTRACFLACKQVLSRSDLNLVTWLCKKVEPRYVFSKKSLTAPVILSLVQQVSLPLFPSRLSSCLSLCLSSYSASLLSFFQPRAFPAILCGRCRYSEKNHIYMCVCACVYKYMYICIDR